MKKRSIQQISVMIMIIIVVIVVPFLQMEYSIKGIIITVLVMTFIIIFFWGRPFEWGKIILTQRQKDEVHQKGLLSLAGKIELLEEGNENEERVIYVMIRCGGEDIHGIYIPDRLFEEFNDPEMVIALLEDKVEGKFHLNVPEIESVRISCK